MKRIILLITLLAVNAAFTFIYPTVSLDILTINKAATYTFLAMRNYDVALSPTPYASQPLPNNSKLVIIMPASYNLTITTPAVTSFSVNGNPVPSFTMSITSNNITITSTVLSNLALANASVTIANITNPYPAITTNPFVIVIGADQSDNSTSSSVTLTADNFISCSIGFSPAYVNTTGKMLVTISPTNKILNNGYIQIQFPSSLQWSQDLSSNHALPIAGVSCTAVTGQILSNTCSGQTSNQIVKFVITSINSTSVTQPLQFSINTLFSPPTINPPDVLAIASYSPDGYQIDTCTTNVTNLLPQQLSLTLTPSVSPLYVNSPTSLTLTFTLTDTISRFDYFQFVFPTNTTFTFGVISVVNLQISTVGYISSNYTLVMRQPISSSTRFAGTVCKITINTYTAPPSTKTTPSFTLQIYNSQNALKMSGTATITAVAKSYTLTALPQSYFINANTTYTFTLTTLDNLLASAMIAITFPAELSLSVSPNCLTANFSSPSSMTCSVNGSNTVMLTNLSTALISPRTYTLTISNLVNTGWALTTSSFNMSIYYSNSTSEMVATASFPGVTFIPNEITASSISASLSDYYVISNPVTINITFVAVDAIPLNGSVYITVPPQIAFVNSYIPQCILFFGASSTIPACTLSNQTISFSTNSLIAGGTTITVQLINCCGNPKSTRPSSFFKVYTYSQNMFMIDYSNNSCQITNFLPAPFFILLVNPLNNTNSASCPYSFNIKQTNSWDANSYLLIQVPSIISVSSNISCLNITSSTNLTCSRITNTTGIFINVSLPNSSSSLHLTINSLINPPSLQQSPAFAVTTYTSDGYAYATDNSTLTVTNTAPSSFSSVTYSFSSQIYNTTTNLTLTITNIISDSNLYRLANAIQFVNTSISNISCTSPSFLLTCYINATSIFIAPTDSSTSFPINTTISINNLFVPLTNLTAMPFSSFANGYLQSTYNSISFTAMCTLPCYTCLSANNSNVCLSCYSTTIFTSLLYFYQQNCYSKCPISSFSPSGSLICEACSAICAECTLATAICTECNTTGSYPVLYLANSSCLVSCPNGTYRNNSTNLTKYTPICSDCVSPCGSCTSLTICATCANSSLFAYQSQCLSSCPLSITVGNLTSMVCQPCAPVCVTCVNTTYTCLVCNSTVAPLFIALNQTCVATCPTPLVSDSNNTLCVSCSSPCNTCSLIKTNCTSCLNGTNTYLSAITMGMCMSSCDQYYYANTTTLMCNSCSSVPNLNCSNCLNDSYCITCNVGYVMFISNHSCLSQTPFGYINISGIAVACNPSCSGCVNTINNCTACIGNLSLYTSLGLGSCVSVCPNSTLSFSSICLSCTYPCRDCSTILTNCTSCLTGYLYTNGTFTYCLTSCPNTTFINSSSLTCQSCQSPCSSCLASSSICTSCLAGSGSLYNDSCYTNCPNQTVLTVITNTCDSCISPCLSCSNLINNCTSCISTFYYFSSTNKCYTVCPINISIVDTANSTLNCLPCNSSCISCSNTQTNCSACALNYSYFNFTCLSVCPLYYFSQAGSCTLCINNCLTCSSSVFCLSCINGTLLYISSCLLSCPVSHSIIVNNTCTECSNQCLNCSVNNVCYKCPTSLAIYSGSCLSVCPSPLILYFNSTSGSLACYTASQLAGEQLQQSLSASAIIPLPFTIVATFLFMCSLMSKLQNINTYTTAMGYSLYGCAQAGALAYLFYIYTRDEMSSSDYSAYSLLIIIGLGIIAVINLISLIFVTPFLCSDPEFNNWLNYRKRGTPPEDGLEQFQTETMGSNQRQNESVECWSHTFTFVFFTLFSSFSSYKFRLIMFSKLFRFNCLSAHLQNIHGFRAFNVLSFFGIAHEGLACYVTIKMLFIYPYGENSRLFLAVVDCLIVTVTAFIFSLVATQKQQDFFKIQNSYQGGVDLGRRKKDKHHLKNLKIDQKRYNSMDSRDKLADMHDSNSDLESEIIVNHNIDMPHHSKKGTGLWVQKQAKVGNIFDGNLDDQSFNPMYIEDPVELYHTSVKPTQVKKQASRASNWVEVEAGRDKRQAKPEVSKVQSNLSNSKISAAPKTSEIKNKSNLNIQSSLVKVQVSQNQPKQPIPKELKEINTPKTSQYTQKQPIIRQTQSQNFSESLKEILQKPSKQIIIASQIQPAKDFGNFEDFQEINHTIGQGQIMGSDPQKSFQSILPFVHQNGILRQKSYKTKNQNQPILKNGNKPAMENIGKQKITKMDMAVGGNSFLLDEVQIQNNLKLPNQNVKPEDFQNILDISEIKFTPPPTVSNLKPQASLAIVESVRPMFINQIKSNQQQEIQVEEIETLDCIDVSIQQTHRTNIVPASPQIQPKIQPTHQQITPVMHAPKVYRNQKQIDGQNVQQIQFDDKLNHFQKTLTKMKEQIAQGKTRLAKKKQQSSDGFPNKRSKKSIKGQIEEALKVKQAKSSIKITESKAGSRIYEIDKIEEVQIQKSTYKHEMSVVKNSNKLGNINKDQKSISSPSQDQRNIFDKCLYTQTQNNKQQIHLQEINNADRLSFQSQYKQQGQIKSSHTHKYQHSIQGSLQKRQIHAPSSNIKEKTVTQNQNQEQTYTDAVIDNQQQSNSQQQQQQNLAVNHLESGKRPNQHLSNNNYQNEQEIQQQDESKQIHQNNPIQSQGQSQKQSQSQNKTAKQSNNDIQQKNNNASSQQKSAQQLEQSFKQNKNEIGSQNNRQEQEQPQEDEDHESENREQPEHQCSASHSQQQQLSMENKSDNQNQNQQYNDQQEDEQQPSVVHSAKESENKRGYLQQVAIKKQSLASQNINSQHLNKNPLKNINLSSNRNYQEQVAEPIIKYQVQKEQRIIRDDQSSAKNNQFTLQNYQKNYQQDISSQNRSKRIESIELKKTSKKFPIQKQSKGHKMQEQEYDHKPIHLVGGKQYFVSEEPFDEDPIFKTKIVKRQSSHQNKEQKPQKTSTDHKQIIDLLRNVNRNSRSKKKLPKEQRDQRILIKMDRQRQMPAPRPYQNTNIVKKSVQKNKPLNNFTFEQKPEYYYQQDSSAKNTRPPLPKINTMHVFNKPKNNQALSSGREEKANSTLSIAQKKVFQQQTSQEQSMRPYKPQQIREFNFGDQISSQVSNFNSQAQLYKWKQKFVQEKAYVNLHPEHAANDMPEQPLINKLSRFNQEGGRQYQEQTHSKDKRGHSSNRKPRSKRKDRANKNSELRKIYGKQ